MVWLKGTEFPSKYLQFIQTTHLDVRFDLTLQGDVTLESSILTSPTVSLFVWSAANYALRGVSAIRR